MRRRRGWGEKVVLVCTVPSSSAEVDRRAGGEVEDGTMYAESGLDGFRLMISSAPIGYCDMSSDSITHHVILHSQLAELIEPAQIAQHEEWYFPTHMRGCMNQQSTKEE